jgi:hypothetical protein
MLENGQFQLANREGNSVAGLEKAAAQAIGSQELAKKKTEKAEEKA